MIASVIIPVFNKEKYLKKCIDVLAKQSIDKAELEAIFIDDGSSDASPQILDEAADSYPWIKAVHQDNGGVHTARNTGIKCARGKYIFYLDPDDEMTANTIKDVSSFFDDHYDQVDLVTYPIIPIKEGKRGQRHFRYNTLVESGVYDLEAPDGYKICQTTMNICVKNKFEDNRLFEFETKNGIVYHEDQQYITEIIMQKRVIGYCSSCEYLWVVNSDSVTSSIVNPYYIFDNTMNMYEKSFASFDWVPPRYIQGLLLNDLGWKMRSNVALPIHLLHDRSAYAAAIERLVRLIDCLDDDLIMEHPNMSYYHKLFFIDMKKGEKVKAKLGSMGFALERGGVFLTSEASIEAVIYKAKVVQSEAVELHGFLKSSLFKYVEETPRLLLLKGSNSQYRGVDIPLSPSSWSRIQSKTETACFYDFVLKLPLSQDGDYSLENEICGFRLKTRLIFFGNDVCFVSKGNPALLCGNTCIEHSEDECHVCVRNLDAKQAVKFENELDRRFSKKIELSRKAIRKRKEMLRARWAQIWIYVDAEGRLDNSWIQFCHDSKIDDGVMRVYVANGVAPSIAPESRNAKIVVRGSRDHKFLHYAANKVIISDITRLSWLPWSVKVDARYRDFFDAEVIYLQHGVLWAHMPWYYSADRVPFDKEVISTSFERENLINTYGFKPDALLECGMPRYSKVDLSCTPKKKILLCPSWRSYLIGEMSNSGRETLPDKFLNSDYYRQIDDFLRSDDLNRLLERFDFTLDVKLHPNFACYKDLFNIDSERIKIVERAETEEYAVAVTDYSSYSFDFLYLKRAVVYFIPDYDLFRAGFANYNDLDIPIDDAFGSFTQTSQEVLRALEEILENDAEPTAKYLERIDGLFFDYDNSQCDRVYAELKR